MSSKGSAGAGGDEAAAAAVMQALQMQTQLQSMLIEGYEWSFKACTSTSSGPALSAKERRCIVQGITNFIDARSHMGQFMMAQNGSKEF